MRVSCPSLRESTLTTGLLWWTYQAPSCIQSQLQPVAHSSPCRLSWSSQPQPSPQVCPLTTESFSTQSGHAEQACISNWALHGPSAPVSLCCVCHKAAATLSSEPLKLPVSADLPTVEGAFQGAASPSCRSPPDSFSSLPSYQVK